MTILNLFSFDHRRRTAGAAAHGRDLARVNVIRCSPRAVAANDHSSQLERDGLRGRYSPVAALPQRFRVCWEMPHSLAPSD